MYSKPYNIYCITETWLNDCFYDNEILPCEYTIYRKDRGSRGGGVLIAVNKSISSTLISSPSDLELVAINLDVGNSSITVCTVYVPPTASAVYHTNLLSYLRNLTLSVKSVVIVGDFNFPDICWSTLSGSSPISNAFCDFVYESNLTQLVDCSTHIMGNTLDLLLTNNASLISNLTIEQPHPLISSDHYTISFKIKLQLSHKCKEKGHSLVFDYSKGDYTGLCDHLLDADFGIYFQSSDIEHVWSVIKQNFLTAMNLFIPKVRLKSHNHLKWYNSEIRHTLNRVRTLREKKF